MKKMQIIKTLVSICFISLFIQCDQWDYKMKITNYSSSAICYNLSLIYPDTNLRIDDNPISISRSLVASGETVSNPRRGSWEGVFDICDTLMIFIFDETTLKTVPWDTVRKNYMILKRYDLSLEDLVRMDWRVTYP